MSSYIEALLLYPLRRTWLRLHGVRLGADCRVGARVKVASGVFIGDKVNLGDGCEIAGKVVLGDSVTIQKGAEVAGNVKIGEATVVAAYAFVSTMPQAQLTIGERVLINCFNVIGAGENLTIGDDCIFAPHVQITDSTHRYENAGDSPRHDPARSKPVAIGKGVWLGSAAKVLMGVHVGDGAVIGANAVVTRDMPSMAIAVGCPARVVRYREPGDGHSGVEP